MLQMELDQILEKSSSIEKLCLNGAGDNTATLHNTRERENPRYTKPSQRDTNSNLDRMARDTHIHLDQGYQKIDDILMKDQKKRNGVDKTSSSYSTK